MSSFLPFTPQATITVAATVTTSVTGSIASIGSGSAVRIANVGSGAMFVKLNSTAATTADMVMLGNTVELFTVGPNTAVANIATLTATGSTSNILYVTRGEGQ